MSVFTQNVIHAMGRVTSVPPGAPVLKGQGFVSVAVSGATSVLLTLQDPLAVDESVVLLASEAGVGPSGDGPRYTRPSPSTVEVTCQLNGTGFLADFSIAVLRIPDVV